MNPKQLFIGILGAALILVGCNERSPVSPDPIYDAESGLGTPSIALSKKSHDDDNGKKDGPFATTIDLSAAPTEVGTVQYVPGADGLHILVTGQKVVGPFVDGDFEGMGTTVLNADILHTATQHAGPAWGTFSFEITRYKGKKVSATWEGTFQGQIEGNLLYGQMTGEGTGYFKKRKFDATFTDAPDGHNLFVITGRIVKAHKDDDDEEDED